MPASASSHVIPPDGHLGPAQGKMTVYEQRARIIYELDRAANKAAQHGAVIEQLERMKGLTSEEVKRLRGQLKAVEQEHKILSQVILITFFFSHSSSAFIDCMDPSISAAVFGWSD